MNKEISERNNLFIERFIISNSEQLFHNIRTEYLFYFLKCKYLLSFIMSLIGNPRPEETIEIKKNAMNLLDRFESWSFVVTTIAFHYYCSSITPLLLIFDIFILKGIRLVSYSNINIQIDMNSAENICKMNIDDLIIITKMIITKKIYLINECRIFV